MNWQSIEQFLQNPVTLQTLEIRIVDVPQKEVFRSSIGDRQSRQAIILRWLDRDGNEGFGECSCRPDPFYSHEFVTGAVQVLSAYIFPLIKTASTYSEVIAQMAKVRGWNFTKAAIEFALNDLVRRKTGIGILESSGLYSLDQVPVGISLGLFDSVNDLRSKLDEVALQQYRRLKFKIAENYNAPGILNEFAAIDHPYIAFDANGAFTPASFDLLNQFAGMGRIIEQPYAPGALYLHQQYLGEGYADFRVCLDEEVESYGHLVSNSLQMQQLNIKPGRVGGLLTTLKMIDFCNEQGIDTWIGGMFETGIGRAQNLQVAALLPNAKAHDLSPSSRYFEDDLLQTPIEMEQGYIPSRYFENPEIDQGTLDRLTTEKITLTNG